MEDFTLLGLVDEDDIVLDTAALALALPDHPETDLQPYEALLDQLAERLGEVGADADTPRLRAAALARVLAGEYGFTGDRDSYDDPANADLIRVIDRRRGLPVSLSILYVAAARRLGWTANLLDIPGHVLVLVGAKVAPVVIDPFRNGDPVAPEQLVALLAAADPGSATEVRQVAAMPNRAVLLRLLRNQAGRAEQAHDPARALELCRRMTAIAPDHPFGWWERARLELVAGEIAAARQSLADLLEVTREPELRDQVADLLGTLARG